TKGEKTISVRSIRSSWEKRQTTLVLIIHTDGVLRLMPIIIFKGKGNMTNEERQAWNKDVKVYFDDNAYNNEELFTRWIFEELIPQIAGKDTLFVMDVASFHKTDQILSTLRGNTVTPAIIPPSYTSLLQPLDTAINGPFKQWLSKFADEYCTKHN